MSLRNRAKASDPAAAATTSDMEVEEDEHVKTRVERVQDHAASALSNPFSLAVIGLLVAVLLGYVWKAADIQKELNIHLEKTKSPVEMYKQWRSEQSVKAVGVEMRQEGYKAKHPVILIPGFVTSGLELWSGHECTHGNFRTRMWTSVNMASSFMSDRECWLQHMSLNFTTGLDPEGIRLRSAQGLDAVDYFFTGYAVWATAIAALADIGYDSTSMVAMPYDWRLSIPNMEFRDSYFTVLRRQIEMFNEMFDEKVLIAGHSWGDNVARAFVQWMEETEPGWVDNHVAYLVNIAGPTLGLPKAATAILSGEMRETSQLFSHYFGKTMLPKQDRTLMWRTWGSALGMLPIGGTKIWGNSTWAPDDDCAITKSEKSFGQMIGYRVASESNATLVEAALSWLPGKQQTNSTEPEAPLTYLDANTVIEEIIKDAGPTYLNHVRLWSSATLPDDIEPIMKSMCPMHCNGTVIKPEGMLPNLSDPEERDDWLKRWASTLGDASALTPSHQNRQAVSLPNPLSTPLPNAPNMKVVCMYGHGLPSERAFQYTYINKTTSPGGDEVKEHEKQGLIRNVKIAQSQLGAGDSWHIDRSAHKPEDKLENGVLFSDGDGTVPLLSLGALCAGGWQQKKLNPHDVKVVTREYQNVAVGNGELADHVQILSNKRLLRDLLKLASGDESVVEDQIKTDILNIAANIDWST